MVEKLPLIILEKKVSRNKPEQGMEDICNENFEFLKKLKKTQMESPPVFIDWWN